MWDRFLGFVVSRSRLALATALALVVGSAALARGLSFRFDPTEQLPTVSPQVTQWLELSRRFDAFNSLLIGLEEPKAPLSAEGLERLKRITDRLTSLKAQGVLAVSSLTNVESLSEGTDGALEARLLVPAIPHDPAALGELSKAIAANTQVSGALVSRDQRGYLIVLRADPRRDSLRLVREIQRVVDEERGPLMPAYFGAAFFSEAIVAALLGRLPWIAPGFLLLLIGALAVSVRRALAIALVIGAALASLLVCLGLLRASGIVLGLTSATALIPVAVLATAAFARALERTSPGGNPFPAAVAAGLAAAGAGASTLVTVGTLAGTGAVLALGAVAVLLVGVLAFAPLAARVTLPVRQPARAGRRVSPRLAVALAGAGLVACGLVAARARFSSTPQTLFSATDEVGRAVAFFDRHFGGPDFVQVDFKGDLRDPAVAARLLRLDELLEGTAQFSDVRSAAQILGFLNQGLGGVHRIPAGRESLANLWFFLEGRPDVRNLVSEARDEAMVVLRVPSRPAFPVAQLTAAVEAAVADSLKTGAPAARLRLLALGRVQRVPIPAERIDEVLAGFEAGQLALSTEVNARLHEWVSSPDSPYQPTDEQWAAIEGALLMAEPQRVAKLIEVIVSFTRATDPAMVGEVWAARLVDSLLAREKDLRLNLRARNEAERLAAGLSPPEAWRVGAQGIFADLLDPHPGAGESATVAVSGLPIVAELLERDLLASLRRGLVLLLGIGAVVLLALRRQPREVLRSFAEAALATTLTLAVGGTLGLGIDAGCAAIFLIPPLVSPQLSSARLPLAFLGSLGAASLALLAVEALPVARLGVSMAVALACVTLVNAAARDFAAA